MTNLDPGTQKTVLYVVAGVAFIVAMLLDAFKPGGEYVAKVAQAVAMLGSGTALGTVLFKKPGQ